MDNKLKIVLPDAKTLTRGDLDLSPLEKYGEVILYDASEMVDFEEIFRDADVILCNKTVLNRDTLKNATKLKYIGITATGYNNVDLEYTRKRGIVVSNTAGYSTEAVAQQTFAYILNHYNQVIKYSSFVNEDGWKNSDTFAPFVFEMHELYNKTIGIIGFGSIGQKVAKIAEAFSMNILVYSRNKEKVGSIINDKFSNCNSIKYASINEVVEKSDIVTLHCPLNHESENLINEELLRKFKKNAYLINTARGGIVDEAALKKALCEGWIAGAAIDTLPIEPMSDNCILQNVENLIITPHVAWAPLETRQRLFDIVVENLEAFLEGNPKSVVN